MLYQIIKWLALAAVILSASCTGTENVKENSTAATLYLGVADSKQCTFNDERIPETLLLSKMEQEWERFQFRCLQIFDGEKRAIPERNGLIQSIETFCKNRDISIIYKASLSDIPLDFEPEH